MQGTALAMEALLAARLISAAPRRVRGGPWLGMTLTKSETKELQAAAACKGLRELCEMAAGLGFSSKLQQHLRGIKFQQSHVKTATKLRGRKVIACLLKFASGHGVCLSDSRHQARPLTHVSFLFFALLRLPADAASAVLKHVSDIRPNIRLNPTCHLNRAILQCMFRNALENI